MYALVPGAEAQSLIIMKNDRILAGFIPLIALLALVATYGGLFLPDLYNDGDYINAQWLGQDFITLIVAVPALLLSAYYALKQGSLKARIGLAGLLFTILYLRRLVIHKRINTIVRKEEIPLSSQVE